ncbi:Transcription factor [Gossypium australe]|uniref:Transcription factor n=1 Tax=Gossypium australe TaxID=47621 RepID=A0A5B6VU95_9ROSI|nr:Transcription factor [Gossypium australe]
MMGGNNQFTAQKEGGVSLGSNKMNNDSVDDRREGKISLKKRRIRYICNIATAIYNELEGGGFLGSNWMNSDGVGIGREGVVSRMNDAMLAEYKRSHGERNWNIVKKNKGLARCGNSCRLSWTNH